MANIMLSNGQPRDSFAWVSYIVIKLNARKVSVECSAPANLWQLPMNTEFEQIWVAALERYLASLRPREILKIEAVTSQQSLLERAKELQKRYGERRITRRLEQVNPFLTTLHSFSEVVKVFLQSDPTVSALVWGSICFVLEVGVMSRPNPAAFRRLSGLTYPMKSARRTI
jgi:hypothetical protein